MPYILDRAAYPGKRGTGNPCSTINAANAVIIKPAKRGREEIMIDLDDLEKKALEATPGPWKATNHSWSDTSILAPGFDHGICCLDANHATEETQEADETRMVANADFIAAANPLAILDLIARCRKAEEEVANLKSAVSHEADVAESYKAESDELRQQLAKAESRVAELEAQSGEAVGEAGSMPGTTGFTMACFKAEAVPVGAKLYLRAPQAAEWQPIETAPKDSSFFLCWVSAVKYGTDDDGRQFEQDVSAVDFCWWRPGQEPDSGYFDNSCDQLGDYQRITHWMPLPAAPSPEGEKE